MRQLTPARAVSFRLAPERFRQHRKWLSARPGQQRNSRSAHRAPRARIRPAYAQGAGDSGEHGWAGSASASRSRASLRQSFKGRGGCSPRFWQRTRLRRLNPVRRPCIDDTLRSPAASIQYYRAFVSTDSGRTTPAELNKEGRQLMPHPTYHGRANGRIVADDLRGPAGGAVLLGVMTSGAHRAPCCTRPAPRAAPVFRRSGLPGFERSKRLRTAFFWISHVRRAMACEVQAMHISAGSKRTVILLTGR